MNGKENIINKILSDAETRCREILSQAHTQAEEIALSARELAQKEKAMLDKRLQALSAERQRNSLANAVLEARKYKLLQKQQLISTCYEKAYAEVVGMSAAKRTAFLTKLLKTYAEKGETVFICKADKDIVTQKFLDGFGKGLVLGKRFIEAEGGLILEGQGYEKDLTLSKVFAYVREQTEAQVANILFGVNNG